MLLGGGMKFVVQNKLLQHNWSNIAVKFYYNSIWENDVPPNTFNNNDSLMITLKIQLYRLLHHFFEMLNVSHKMYLNNVFLPSIVENNMDLNSIYI